ncbi:MAG TPA: phage tail protein, partial [Thermoanaerobaculia bacterium]
LVGALELRGLLLFDLHAGGPPRVLAWPRDIAFAPFDLIATTDGGVAILDQKNQRVWQLDSGFEVVAPNLTTKPALQFQPLDDSEPMRDFDTQPLTLAHSIEVPEHSVSIEALNDGSLLVLTSPPGERFSTIRHYRDGALKGTHSTQVASALIDSGNRRGFSLLVHDFVRIVRGDEELLATVGAGGDQALLFRIRAKNDGIRIEPLAEFVAMRLFGGKGLASSGDKVFYDFGPRWLPLVTQDRGRYERSATIRVVKLDGKQPDCVWHRLFLDACIPPDCDVVVRTRCANDEKELAFAPLVDEPRLIRRSTGSELPWVGGSSTESNASGLGGGLPPTANRQPPTATWELLFQSSKGRYLQLELTLLGTGRTTPRIRAMRAYYPRFSYLEKYLPAVYRENAASASFLDRFLALFEGFYTNIEDRIAAVQTLFDVRSAPPDALEWLASWLSVAYDPSWPDKKRRLFLKHAVDFFAWRGTRPAILAALRLALEDCPRESLFDFEAKSPRSGVRIVERPANAQRSANVKQLWTRHLQRTHGSVAALNASNGTTFTSLDEIEVGRVKSEWDAFKTYVMPVHERAHHFTVFIPLPPGTDGSAKLDLARRVVQLEKPAHTTFNVDFYWTWFRLGEARLGADTVVDRGSRSPFLIAPYAVNRTRIGNGYLSPDTTRIGPGRTILGRGCARRPVHTRIAAGETR